MRRLFTVFILFTLLTALGAGAQTIASPASGATVTGWTEIVIDPQGKTFANLRCLHDTPWAARYSRYGFLPVNYSNHFLWDTSLIPDEALTLTCQVMIGGAGAQTTVTMKVPLVVKNSTRQPGPAVRLISPVKGAYTVSLKGETLIQADSPNAVTVQYFVANPGGAQGGGAAISDKLPPPFAFQWNSRSFPSNVLNGDLVAVATDASGNTSASAPLRVIFR